MDRSAAAARAQGRSFPLGATPRAGGVNFSVFAKHATAVELLLFDRADDPRPARVIELDPRAHRTYHYWHAFVPDIAPGQLYAYRAHGPFAPEQGLRFDATKVLLDPYGKGVAWPAGYSRAAACRPGDNAATALKSVVVDPDTYDWEGDARPRRPFAKTVIYELHVAGFTRHPDSGVGTGAARDLRRPDREDSVPRGPRGHRRRAAAGVRVRRAGRPARARELLGLPAGRVLRAASRLQLAAPTRRGALDEFRDMVKALHRAGHRGDPRRRLQPHRGGRRGRADALVPRARQRHVLHPRREPRRLRRLHRLRQHARRERVDRPAPDPRQPPLLGARDARRRLPLRPRLDPRARRRGPADGRAAGALGHRVGPGARERQADRRSLGCGRPLPGRQLRRRQLEGMERPVPRRRARLPQGRRPRRSARSPAG